MFAFKLMKLFAYTHIKIIKKVQKLLGEMIFRQAQSRDTSDVEVNN